jgi:hypothetical protein
MFKAYLTLIFDVRGRCEGENGSQEKQASSFNDAEFLHISLTSCHHISQQYLALFSKQIITNTIYISSNGKIFWTSLQISDIFIDLYG